MMRSGRWRAAIPEAGDVPGMRRAEGEAMVRRLMLLVMVGIAVMATLVAPASAQDSPGPTVAPTVVEREAPPPTVAGVTVAPLPRTGDDFGMQVMVGAGLTAAGLAFAVSARLRRHRVAVHAHS